MKRDDAFNVIRDGGLENIKSAGGENFMSKPRIFRALRDSNRGLMKIISTPFGDFRRRARVPISPSTRFNVPEAMADFQCFAADGLGCNYRE